MMILAEVALMLLLGYMLFGAVIQQSFRMNPPTAEELAQDPSLERYLP